MQLLHISRDHFDVDGAMEQRFFVPVQRADEVRHVLQIALCFHRPLHILGAAAVHPVADLGVMDDFAFFERRDHACIDVQRHAVLFAQMPQDGKIVGRCWVLAQRPNAAERVAADVIAGFKFHDAGRDHVEEGFQRFCFRVGLLFSSENTHPVASMNR